MRNTIFLIFFLLFIGCLSSTDIALIPGKYTSKEYLRDTISLSADYRYVYSHTSLAGKVYTISGKWVFNKTGQRIEFESFQFLTDEGATGSGPLSWYSRVENHDGEIRLIYASDSDIFYSKIK